MGPDAVCLERNPLHRYYGHGDLHFVTFSCYCRQPLLDAPEARDRFAYILDQARQHFGFRLVGYVVMPEHVHLLMSEPKNGDPSKVLQALKQRVSRALTPKRGRHFPTQSGSQAHFWQRRFYDFNVWSAAKVREKLDYMHANPVKRKLVELPGQWPWSSWSHYEGGCGLIPIDAAEPNAG